MFEDWSLFFILTYTSNFDVPLSFYFSEFWALGLDFDH